MRQVSTPTGETRVENPAIGFTPRTRLLGALRGQPVDRVPAWMMRQAGRYLPQYHEVRRNYDFLTLCKTPEAAAEVSIQPLDAIGSEAVIVFNDILVPLEHCGAMVEFDDHGPLVTNPVRKSEDLEAIHGHGVSRYEPVAQTIRLVRERVGAEMPILGFIGAPWTLAAYWVEGRVGKQFRELGSLRFRDPQLLETLLDRIADVAAEYLAIQIEAGADAVQIFDTWGSLLGADEYERFSGRTIRRIVQRVKPLGAPIIVYVNGAAPYLDQLAGLGADALSVDWRTPLAAARKAVSNGIALQGNLDPLALVAGPDATERRIHELLAEFPPAPGWVFNLGHGILPQTPVEAARRAMDTIKRHGHYRTTE